MKNPDNEFLYHAEVLEGLQPGTPEHRARFLSLKTDACAKKRKVRSCLACDYRMFCPIAEELANLIRARKAP